MTTDQQAHNATLVWRSCKVLHMICWDHFGMVNKLYQLVPHHFVDSPNLVFH